MNKLLVFLLALSQMMWSQFNISAEIKPVAKTATYRLLLPTQIASASKENFSDLRILDSKNQEVPYVLLENVIAKKTNKIDFKISSRSSIPDKISSLIFENQLQKLDFVNLEIANYSGSKTFIVSGSDDQKQWFGVLDPTILNDLHGPNLSVLATLNFPKTNYKFIKIETIDKNSLPINIMKIGQIGVTYGEQNFEKIVPKSLQIKQFQSEKKTRIFVEFQNSELIDKLQFDIKSPSNYKRNIRLYENFSDKRKPKSRIRQLEFDDFVLTTISNDKLNLNQKRTREFTIEIDNLDNAPLEIKTVNFYQEVIKIAMVLHENEKYVLKTNNKNAFLPNYDISEIQISNIENLPIAAVLNVREKQNSYQVKVAKNFWNSPYFLWICIGIATIAVLYFVFGLLKDIKKSS